MKNGPSINKRWTPFRFITVLKPDGSELWTNKTHAVQVKHMTEAGLDGFVYLSIKRLDRRAECDWRIFQRIKNDLVGLEREAVQLFPANSRVNDSANQYHLWVAPAGQRYPIGFEFADVMTPEDLKESGAEQREFDDDDPALQMRKKDLTTETVSVIMPNMEGFVDE